jgi:Winged helix DNA-binding domain
MAAGGKATAAAERPLTRLGWGQVRAWRLRRHHLDERAPRDAMLDVVAGIAGLHAQVLSSAELTLWARVDGLDPGALRRALWVERSLVKTWAMRGTLHLLPAAEFPLWQAALSTRRGYQAGAWLRGFGVTREELAAKVAGLTGSAALGDKLRESWGAMLKPAASRGHLCFADNRGQQVQFTRPDRWLGAWREEDPEAALDEVTRRFLAASGPVTREDYARWWGIPSPARAGRLLERLGAEVARVDVEGTGAWMLAGQAGAAAGARATRSVRLLPAFDQYVVTATRQADHLMPGPFRDRIYRPQGWLSPVLLVDGRMDGVWRHEIRGRAVAVRIEPFTTLPAWARRAAAAEAERLAAFLGGGLRLDWADA